jgi:pSer/pThr/pTyr-binding forkhead associated (FHA) protein
MNDPARPSETLGRPATTSNRAARPTLPPDFAPLRLVLLPTGASVELRQADALVGRHSDADVRLPLPDVSRRHCRLVFVDSCWHVIDLNSLNGVFVNEQRVQQTVLRHRDTLRIGGFTFLIELQAQGAGSQEKRRAS